MAQSLFVKLSPYLIAMLIGLLIGVERERRGQQVRQAMGLRSFLIIALGGAIAGGVNQPLIAVGLLVFVALASIASYILVSWLCSLEKKPTGITTELAAMAVFGLGYLAHSEPFLSLVLGVILLLFLHNKTILHTFVNTYLEPKEIQAAAVLIFLMLGVVPLLPDKSIDPFKVLNPHTIGLVIALIASMQFISYVAVRVFGERLGFPISGFLAGIISSTAAFLTYPKQVEENPKHILSVASAVIFSITSTLIEMMVILAVLSIPVTLALMGPVLAIVLISAAAALILARKASLFALHVEPKNPLRLWSAIKVGVLIISFTFLIGLTERYLGTHSTNLVTFIGAMFLIDSVVIANVSMFDHQVISLEACVFAIMVGILGSLVSKILITLFISKGIYRKVVSYILFVLLTVCGGLLFLIMQVPAILYQI